MSQRRPRLAVVGSLNADLVVSASRLPRPGETVTGDDWRQLSGGKGANQAVAAARLGADVAMIGRIGDDPFGLQLRRGLAEDGVDVTGVRTTADCGSGLAVIQVDREGRNSIVVTPGANGRLSAADVEASAAAIVEADLLLVQLEVPWPTVRAAIEIARRASVPVLLDPAPAPESAPDELFEVDYLTPNESEAAALTGRAWTFPGEAAEAARTLQRRGARCVLVTLGEHGVSVADASDGSFTVEAPRIAARDTTAAGDAFAAAFAVRRAEGAELRAAIRFGCAAGSLAAERPGAQPSLPWRAEVERRAAENW